MSDSTWTYADHLIRLFSLGETPLTAEIEGTGGNCRAIVVRVPGLEVLITDGDAGLPTWADNDDDESSVTVSTYLPNGDPVDAVHLSPWSAPTVDPSAVWGAVMDRLRTGVWTSSLTCQMTFVRV